jgi:ubiquinone/menaquinone biosynthesis C-methylase UbiE
MRAPTILPHPDAEIRVEEIGEGQRRIAVEMHDPSRCALKPSCVTSYPLEIIATILGIKGPASLCDEIERDSDPAYVEWPLLNTILGYVDSAEFAGKRILDFGCGSGASTVILARAFPDCDIVGLDMDEALLSVARARVDYYHAARVRIEASPNGECLPAGIGQFDFVIMNGVYEHLLPAERRVLMPRIWCVVKPGGILFVNETPNRYFPLEFHTTQLPFVNYLPDRLALFVSRRWSKMVGKNETWESLLRQGIRGGTAREVRQIIAGHASGRPLLLTPCKHGCRDEIDLWFMQPGGKIRGSVRKALRIAFKVAKLTTGISLPPSLSLAIRRTDGLP